MSKHFPDVEYALECDDCVLIGKRKFPLFKMGDDWNKFKGDMSVKLPNMRSEKAKALLFLRECFERKTGDLFGLNVSSSSILVNYNFDFVSVNPQQVAMFKEFILPNGKRVDSTDWRKILKYTKMIDLLGYKNQDIHNASYSTLVEFNIKSYLYMVHDGEMVKKVEKEAKKEKKVKENVVSPMLTEKVTEISRKGVESRELYSQTFKNCDYCSMADRCIDRADNSLCVKQKKFKVLAEKFKTRDLEIIYDGLTDVISNQGIRYGKAVEIEEMTGQMSSETTVLENSLIKNAKDLILMIKNPSGVKWDDVNKTMEELSEQLTGEERKQLGEAIGGILKERRYQRARDGSLVTEES